MKKKGSSVRRDLTLTQDNFTDETLYTHKTDTENTKWTFPRQFCLVSSRISRVDPFDRGWGWVHVFTYHLLRRIDGILVYPIYPKGWGTERRTHRNLFKDWEGFEVKSLYFLPLRSWEKYNLLFSFSDFTSHLQSRGVDGCPSWTTTSVNRRR